MSIHYAREQLGNAVFATLATGAGRIQERIVDAWVDSLIHINEERDLPEDLRPRWEMIRALVTHEPGPEGRGALRATVLPMDDEAAIEVARHIVDFHRLVEDLPGS
ncbi:MAG: hypothetical protein M3O23_04600 [Actinomycetota bacterium]|nr:hypothetical protein [Actinomycetota bacterium]